LSHADYEAEEQQKSLTKFCQETSGIDQGSIGSLKTRLLLHLVTSEPGNMLTFDLTLTDKGQQINSLVHINDVNIIVMHLFSFLSDPAENIIKKSAALVEVSVRNTLKHFQPILVHHHSIFVPEISDSVPSDVSSDSDHIKSFRLEENVLQGGSFGTWKITGRFFDPQFFMPPVFAHLNSVIEPRNQGLLKHTFQPLTPNELFSTFDDVCDFYELFLSKYVSIVSSQFTKFSVQLCQT